MEQLQIKRKNNGISNNDTEMMRGYSGNIPDTKDILAKIDAVLEKTKAISREKTRESRRSDSCTC